MLYQKQFHPIVEYDLHDAMTPLKEGGTPNNTFEKEASFSYLYIVVVGIFFQEGTQWIPATFKFFHPLVISRVFFITYI